MEKGSGMAGVSLKIAKPRRFGMALAFSRGNCELTCLTLEIYHGLPAPQRSIRPSGREARIGASTKGAESDQEGGASNGRQAG